MIVSSVWLFPFRLNLSLNLSDKLRDCHTIASADSMLDRVKTATFMGTDRPHVLRQAIHCCRNFGTVSVVGVYGGFLDKIPMGSAINRGLTFPEVLGLAPEQVRVAK